MPYKANEARRHKIPRARYGVTNWPEYDRALQQRGSLTGSYSTRGEDGLALECGTNSLRGVGAAPRRGADDRAHRSVEIGAPGGSETAGDLAIGGGRPKLSLAPIVVGGN
jgi:hypothetical protein